MKILIRSFNDSVNSKSGAKLPDNAPRRGTKEWFEFEDILIKCLKELGHDVRICKEWSTLVDPDLEYTFDKRIYVHQNKKTKLDGNLYYMQMHCRDLFTIDSEGWGFDNSNLKECTSYLEDKEDSTKFCNELADKFHATGLSKHEQPQITDSTPEKFIFVPVQTPRDYTIVNHSPITVKFFLESVCAWAEENQYHIVIKMHPKNTGDLDLHNTVDYACNSRYVHKVNGNIHELIKRSSGLFTINSGVGFEALIQGKPVVTFGNADYNRVTFNGNILRLNEARNFLFGFKPDDRVIMYQFVYWYYHRHAYCLSLPNTKERLMSYLKEKLV